MYSSDKLLKYDLPEQVCQNMFLYIVVCKGHLNHYSDFHDYEEM